MSLSTSAELFGYVNAQPLITFLLDRIKDAAFLVDTRGSFTYGNSAACKFLDCSIAELLTMTIPDLPLVKLPHILSVELSKAHPETISIFTDRYTTTYDDRDLLVEVIMSYDKESEQEHRCLLIHSVKSEPEITKTIFPCIPQLEEIFKFIGENYSQSISLKDVATAMGYSPSYLTDLVRRSSGQTVNHWIIQCRITSACRLLQDTELTIKQIAEYTGYQNEGHFFRQFRQRCGTTPLAWRRSQRIGCS